MIKHRNSMNAGMSLLDKLIDHNPETAIDVAYPLTDKAIVQGLIRDVEALLNSRTSWLKLDPSLSELAGSIVGYGLPDFSSMPFSSKDGQQYLREIVRTTLLDFEPRFKHVSVEIVSNNDNLDRILRLRITARYYVDNEVQELILDSEVEPVSLGIKLSEPV